MVNRFESLTMPGLCAVVVRFPQNLLSFDRCVLGSLSLIYMRQLYKTAVSDSQKMCAIKERPGIAAAGGLYNLQSAPSF